MKSDQTAARNLSCYDDSMKQTPKSNLALKTLSEYKLSVTKPRVAILTALIEAGAPVSVDILQKKVGSTANYVTFYRVLKQFVHVGIVHQTDFREGKSYYEYQRDGHHHHHITCMECGMREDTDDCHETDEYKHVLSHSRKFKTISSHTLEFFGVCKHCSK